MTHVTPLKLRRRFYCPSCSLEVSPTDRTASVLSCQWCFTEIVLVLTSDDMLRHHGEARTVGGRR